MNIKTFVIPNINCQHCIHTITSELRDLQGVKDVQAKLELKEIEVSFEPPATEEEIIEILKEINYPPMR